MGIYKLIAQLKKLKKEILCIIILELLKSEKITFHDIAEQYIQYINSLKECAYDDYSELKTKVIEMFTDKKKNMDKNLKNIMHYLLDKGRINMTHEKIDKR